MEKKVISAKDFSKFTIDKIEALNVLSNCEIVTSKKIGERLNRVSQRLGGGISSLARTKIDGEPLIIPLAKDPKEGTIWKLNENIASREKIKETADSILLEVGKWRKSK